MTFTVKKTPDLSKAVFPVNIELKVRFPASLELNNSTYWRTGKIGTDSETDSIPVAEYEDRWHNRIWLDINGNTRPV